MFWCLVCFSTGALSGGLHTNPLEMAIQSAVACSEAKDGGLLVSWKFGLCPPVFLFIVNRSLTTSVGQIMRCDGGCYKLICCYISPDADVCWYPLKKNAGSLCGDADVLCELFL